MSVLENALDAIAAGIVALEPPSTGQGPARAYERLAAMEPLEGTSGHRTFWFEIPSGGEVSAMGAQLAVLDHDVRMRVRLSSVGVDVRRLPAWVAHHAVGLLNRCNRLASYGTGIRSIRASRYDVEQIGDVDPETGEVLPSGDLDVVISLRVRAEETDG